MESFMCCPCGWGVCRKCPPELAWQLSQRLWALPGEQWPCSGRRSREWLPGMTWHGMWRGRSDVLWMLTAQDMGRYCLSQWDECLFTERTERLWTPDINNVEFWAFFCPCDLDFPVLLSHEQGPRASGCTSCYLALLWALLASYTSFLRGTVS